MIGRDIPVLGNISFLQMAQVRGNESGNFGKACWEIGSFLVFVEIVGRRLLVGL